MCGALPKLRAILSAKDLSRRNPFYWRKQTELDEQGIKGVPLLENIYLLKLAKILTCFQKAAYTLGKHIYGRLVGKLRNTFYTSEQKM